MDKRLNKNFKFQISNSKTLWIAVLILAIAWISPLSVLAFFAQSDPYIHSMPFGVQKNYPGNEKIALPPGFDLNKGNSGQASQNPGSPGFSQTERLQNSQNSGQNFQEVAFNSPAENLFWPILIIILLLPVIYLIARNFLNGKRGAAAGQSKSKKKSDYYKI